MLADETLWRAEAAGICRKALQTSRQLDNALNNMAKLNNMVKLLTLSTFVNGEN